MITTDYEASRNISLTTDVDNLRARYRTSNNYFSFPSFEIWAIEKNLFYLLQRSKQIPMEPKYRFRPDYVSYDEYGTTVLWPIILFVNGVYCIEEFDIPTIYIPDFAAIVELARDRFVPKTIPEYPSINI